MPSSDYTPSTADVGAILRARTVDVNGRELGTFTVDTRPTAVEADNLISAAVDEVYPELGEDIPDAPGTDPDALRKAAKRLVAILAAAKIELSYFPEQVGRGTSPYQQLMDAFDAGLARLTGAIQDVIGGEDPSTGGSMMASFDFPENAGGMVGWGTVW